MNYRGVVARVWIGAVLLSGCPGTDKGDTEATGDGSATGEMQTTGTSTGTGDASTSDAPTSSASASTSSGGEPASACEQYNAADLAGREDYCPCAVEAGEYPDVEACLASGAEEHEANDCYCQIEAMDPAHGEYVACLAAASAGYNTCVAPLSCAEKTNLGPQETACFGEYLQANGACYRLSKAAVLAEEACLEWGPPVMCGSGETIPIKWLCDGFNDCMDMFDESEEMCGF